MNIYQQLKEKTESMRKVFVMMSSYNGYEYIEEQIDSIFKQHGVDTTLFVRDDGSTDGTVELLEKAREKYKQIIIYKGSNIGWKRSFIWLLQNTPGDADYYAFADQDDVWQNDKLISGINRLEENNESPCVYCSNLTFVDEKLNKLDMEWRKKFKYPNMYHCIVNGYGMGNTIVFNSRMLELLRQSRLDTTGKISHDVLVSVIAVYLGHIIFDDHSHILYRIHGNNSGSKSRGLMSRLSRALDYSVFFFADTAAYLFRNYYDQLSENQRQILGTFMNMKKIRNKIKLIFNPFVGRDTFFGSLKVKCYIALYK